MKSIFIIIFIIEVKLKSTSGNNDTSFANYNPAELLGKIFNFDSAEDIRNIDSLSNLDADKALEQQPRQYGFYQTNPGYEGEQFLNTFDDPNKSKRRRRRRKPKKQNLQEGQEFSGFPEQNPNFGYFDTNNQVHRPTRRPPRPSIASGALNSIVGALTSIALYDDRQCVPRLLCEAAGGGSLGSSSLLNSVSGLQPLLTLLSAYNGLSTSPLFVFGRAVFLGMTSKDNPGTCRYAYPTCPTDPEQLVYYLNNHNGGFFRFFNAPHLSQPHGQNVQQLYQHLSGQYGLLPNSGYEENSPAYAQKPGLYGKIQNYDRDNTIEERIQNKPNKNLNEFVEDRDTNWRFPDEVNNDFYEEDDVIRDNAPSIREVKSLKFPDELSYLTPNYKQDINYNKYSDTKRGKMISFPFNEKYKIYYNNYEKPDYKDYVYDYKHKIYVKKHNDDDGYKTVYVVRGDGDVNHPEVVRLRPGESLPK
ncbi:uncharacterized protein LOC105841563 [Bombyx mori]|uniref:Uncharacterized protein n=1 Tax=Bombyx mori TaxID=7091 RepID=A0A8R2C5U5_BOMMO|nr:uncharacterized protein LOC105841563 [Bombyx mori]